MILADKIINERKKCGWSQEELAEKLSVSRQSVSKWEGAQSVPDLNKIIMMADIFGVSTDYLLKDEIEPSETVSQVSNDNDSIPPVRKVSMEEANEFMELTKYVKDRVVWGVMLCILSPLTLIALLALNAYNPSIISEDTATVIGIVVVLLMVCAAVFIFMIFGKKANKYNFLHTDDFETAYGVTGMLKEKKARIETKNNMKVALSVILIIVAFIPVVIAGFLNASDAATFVTVDVLLVAVSAAVYNFIKVSSENAPITVLLQEGEFTKNSKRSTKKLEPVRTAYWCLATAAFFAYSFITNDWGRSWIIWPVSGILYVVVAAIAKMAMKIED